MNLLKQNSDYALRIMVNLGENSDAEASISANKLAHSEDISEQFTAKILQKLAKAGLVESVMGVKGGYRIAKKPQDITMLEVIEAMQGAITLNNCSPGIASCPRQPSCPIAKYVCILENDVLAKLSKITLMDIINNDREMKGVKNG